MQLQNFYAQDVNGNIVPGAACTLFIAGTATLATGLQDASGNPLSNPFSANSGGLASVAAPQGVYDLQMVSGLLTSKIQIQFIDVAQVAMDASSAATSASNAQTAYNQTVTLTLRFIAPKSADPATRDNGGALVAGDMYLNTTIQANKTYTGSAWITDVTSTALNAALLLKADNAYMAQTVPLKLAETPSVKDYSSIAVAEAAVAVAGGTLKYPAGAYPGDIAQTVGNVLREYFGPSSPVNSYSEADAFGVSARVFKYSDATNHIGKEGYTTFVESRPKGSTDGSVPGSDFGSGVSIIKQNWRTSIVEGQACSVNVISRGGYFLLPQNITAITKANPAVVTTAAAHGYSNGDSVIIQAVVGMPQVNGYRKYTVAGATTTTFQLSGVDSTSFGTYTSGGIVQKDSGVAGFYNPGDTAGYISNNVQSSANGFAAILEGASYFMPGGSFNGETVGVRVQLGAIKKSENLAIGVLSVAANGNCGAAFQAQNSRADAGIEGSWTEAFAYIANLGAGAYKAFNINQLGQIGLHGGTSATTPKKTIRANQTNGSLEVVNDANTAVIFTVSDAGSLNLPVATQTFSIGGVRVMGPRVAGWNAPTGTQLRGTFDVASATTATIAQTLAALIADLRTQGPIGT